jgi:hypothetical protein
MWFHFGGSSSNTREMIILVHEYVVFCKQTAKVLLKLQLSFDVFFSDSCSYVLWLTANIFIIGFEVLMAAVKSSVFCDMTSADYTALYPRRQNSSTFLLNVFIRTSRFS